MQFNLVPITSASTLTCISHRSQVEGVKAFAARLKSEAGDMRSVLSTIQDSVLAAGMDLDKYDENGEPLGTSQVG